MTDGIRIGAVSYLNSRPLVYGLEHGLGGGKVELSYGTPATLADRMVTGELDLGLLPVVELARMPELELVPGLGIVAAGPCRSVLLVCKLPIEQIESVALDAESRTSNALARVLFSTFWRRTPAFTLGAGSLNEALEHADAAVRIGDKALFEPPPDGAHVYDLGTVWHEATRLPFVFAAWAARPGLVDRELYRTLHESRRRGSAALERIAREYTWKGESKTEIALRYLTENILFRLGSSEIRAMKLFFRAAAEIGVIERAPEIKLALKRWTTCHETAKLIEVHDGQPRAE